MGRQDEYGQIVEQRAVGLAVGNGRFDCKQSDELVVSGGTLDWLTTMAR